MLPYRFEWPAGRAAIVIAISLCPLIASEAIAGNGANFVTYDHHTEDKGTTEIKVYNDLSRTAGEGERYSAQLVELERALTDQWVVAAYLESHKINGEDWSFDGARFETRYRLFEEKVPLNPVVYLEYVNKKESALYLREVTGRAEPEEAGEPEDENEREHELESKLILGEDITNRLRVGFNWINEVNLKSGEWEFGYATGLTYTLFELEGGHESPSFDIKEVQLGLEVFGGLGDSAEGLTLSGRETEQYLGTNLKVEFANGAMLMAGGAFGLTSNSEDAVFRLMVGWEFE